MRPTASALVKDGPRGWLQFSSPGQVHCAHSHAKIPSVIKSVEMAAGEGRYCVGYISYEAAPAFDPALPAMTTSEPLVWFREYSSCRRLKRLPGSNGTYQLSLKRAGLTRGAYRKKISAIKTLLKSGATYQVNFTFPIYLDFRGDPFALFAQLQESQQSNYSAFIDVGDRTVCSVSPELFFWKEGRIIESRPMKGTASRHPDPTVDRKIESSLRDSKKNAAENVMIVDMIRNDLGRISAAGTVKVRSLFDIEKYPTVFQATSTIRGQTRSSLADTLKALFPCASVTGAPKVETMRIIKDLEAHPRGIYTGAIGYVSRGRSSFNVGIRTLDIARDGSAVYGTGSGIVWESDADCEYDECIAKSKVLFADRRPFDLLETMLWERGRGVRLSREHVDRIARSAAYFGYPTSRRRVRQQLSEYVRRLKRSCIVRMLLSNDGSMRFRTKPIAPARGPWKVAIAKTVVDSGDCFLYHKTTNRTVYDRALQEKPGADDMLLFNERGELTESCKANVVVVLGRVHYTPPIKCGVLAGTLREVMLRRGELRERVIHREDLVQASSVYLINSVRGRIPIVLEGVS